MTTSATAASHLPVPLLERYAASAAGPLVHDEAWTVEAHLESCAECRHALADVVERTCPPIISLIDQVATRLAAGMGRTVPVPVRASRLTRRVAGWTRSWTAPATLPRVLMTLLVIAAAVALDLADTAAGGRFPSLVLLVAPVAPLAGVAAAWSRRLDPAYEVVNATARAGLDLVLRRTLTVLVLVIPAVTVAGALVGVSPARWLLPSLAFTAGALALGEVIGLRRAAGGLALVWAVAIAGPSLWWDHVPVVLQAVARPAWAALLVTASAVLVMRRRTYTRPANLT
jgi:hypothetical protein